MRKVVFSQYSDLLCMRSVLHSACTFPRTRQRDAIHAEPDIRDVRHTINTPKCLVCR